MSMSLSAKRQAPSSRIPSSPSFAPRKLGFTNDEMNEFQTPQANNRRRSNANQMKENVPTTPMSTADDSQYRNWLQGKGFVDIFRNPKVLAAIIKALRLYSQEIGQKVEQVLNQNNQLQTWRIETGEPALQRIERHKLVENELKSVYESKKTECEQYETELKRLKLRINDTYAPRMREYEALMKQNEALTHENDRQKNENRELKEKNVIQKEEYEAQIQQMNDALRKYTESEQQLPPQFINSNSNRGFDWDFAMNDDEEEEEEEEEETNPPHAQPAIPLAVVQREEEFKKYHEIMQNSLHGLLGKITSLSTEQTKTVQSLSHSLKTHLSSNIQQTVKIQNSEFAKLNETLLKVHNKQDGILDMKQSLASLNTSMSTIRNNSTLASSLFYNEGNPDVNSVQQKMDKLFAYVRNLKLDQRLITVYRKINERMDESTAHLQNIVNTQNTIAFGQESQQKLIDNSLATFRELFENELTDISKVVKDIKETQAIPAQSEVIFDDKPLSPIQKKSMAPDTVSHISALEPFDADTLLNAIHATKPHDNNNNNVNTNLDTESNCNAMIEMKCNRLNEMIISEFVLVLMEHLSSASQDAFNKLFVMIRNIIHQLVSIQLQSMKSVVVNFTSFNRKGDAGRNNNDNNNTLSSVMLTQYKSEVDGIFKHIFQSTINNVLKELIDDKIERVKVQSKIAKLQSKMVVNHQNNIDVNRRILQMDKISFKQMYYTLMSVVFGALLIGIAIGYCFISTHSSSPPHPHQVSYSFMS